MPPKKSGKGSVTSEPPSSSASKRSAAGKTATSQFNSELNGTKGSTAWGGDRKLDTVLEYSPDRLAHCKEMTMDCLERGMDSYTVAGSILEEIMQAREKIEFEKYFKKHGKTYASKIMTNIMLKSVTYN